MSLDQRRQRKDDTYPVIFRITYQGKSRDIPSGFTCKLTEWDSRYNTIKGNSDELKLLSKRLNEQRMKHQQKLLEFERKLLEPTTDVQFIKEYLSDKLSTNSTVKDFWLEEIERLEQSKKYGNARNYRSAMLGIETVKKLNKPFSAVDYSWLIQLDSQLRSNGLKPNSVAVYMRTLRALYNKAINHGIASADDYPFRRYKIKGESRTPRVACIEDLKQFFAINLHESHPLFDHWNYGRLIFMLRGINFADLALLTKDNIKDDRIAYKRQKTHKIYSVSLVPLAKKLFSYYQSEERTTLLPLLQNHEFEQKEILPSRIGQLRKTTNKWLKVIGREVGIKEPLTSYVFRYSHATACKKMGYSKDLISESLGHAYGLAVSSAYLENYDVELIDEMNNKVCAELINEI